MAFDNTKATNRETTGILLPTEVSSEIWAKTIESSAVMQLARRIELPGAGMEFEIITGDAEANWVNEMGVKPVSNPSFGSKKMKGYTMAVIIPFSNQFRRDKARLYDEIVARTPQAFGTKLDHTVFCEDNGPGELFDTFKDVTSVEVAEKSVWKSLVTADANISSADGILNGWAITPQFKSILLNELDETGRPLFINSMTNDSNVPAVMGQPTYVKKGVYKAEGGDTGAQLGVAGDWTNALYGVVEDISMDITDQSTITIDGAQVNLWERNMFAVRFEFEVGFRFKFEDQFVKLVAPKA